MPSVLLIEDDPGQRTLVQRMLGQAHSVTWCADRQTALAQLSAGQHDVWLIDYYLADGDGLDLLAAARRQHPHTAAILLTGTADPLVDRRALELGAAARLDKNGLTAERLSRAISFALHHARLLARFAERDAARQRPTVDAERLTRLARAEQAVRAALAHDAIGLDRALFFGRLLHAGLDLTGCRSGVFGTLEHHCVIPEALVGVLPTSDADDRPFEPGAGSLLARALATGEPTFAEGTAAQSGMPGWSPPDAIALPLAVGGRIAAVVLLAGRTADPEESGESARVVHDLLEIYVELCGGALERHALDARRRRAEADLEHCDRLLRAVTGMAQRLPALDDERAALRLAGRCLGRAGGAEQVVIVERGAAGDWYQRIAWSRDGRPAEDPRASVRLVERVTLEFAHSAADPWPRAVPTMPGRPSLIAVPIHVPIADPAPAPPDGTADVDDPTDAPAGDSSDPNARLWGAVALVGSPIDAHGVARGILRSAAQAIGGHLGRLDALRRMRRAQDARDASARRFRALAERSGDIVLVVDAEGHIVWQSPAAAEHLAERRTAPRPALSEWVHPDDHPRWRSMLDEIGQRPGQAGHSELRLRGHGGEWRIFATALCNAFDDPAVAGIIVGARDVTAQRRLWRHFARARTIESLDRMANALAHELNNILTVILTSAAIARDILADDHPVGPDLGAITDAARAGARLAHRLMQFTGAQPATLRPVDVDETLRAAHPLLSNIVGSGVRLVIEPAADVGRMLADAEQITGVLIALVLNAREALDEHDGTGRIVIGAHPARGPTMRGGQAVADEKRPYVVLTVADNGRGMSLETQRRIFEPFFTTKNRLRGAGMGLATVFGVVRRHSGRLTVESAPGQGSAFHVWIPRAADADG